MIHDVDVCYDRDRNVWQAIIDQGVYVFEGTESQCWSIAMKYMERGESYAKRKYYREKEKVYKTARV
jgi:hypothetical protein